MADIEWEEPPALALARVRTPGRYLEFAHALREHPGKWAVLPEFGTKRTEKAAASIAQNIRRGVTAGFDPKGTYESVHDESGKVWVRFIGPGNDPSDRDEDRSPTSGPRDAEGEEDGASPPSSPSNRAPAPVVRAWATRHGINVPMRGRIPDEVWEAYDRAVNTARDGLRPLRTEHG